MQATLGIFQDRNEHEKYRKDFFREQIIVPTCTRKKKENVWMLMNEWHGNDKLAFCTSSPIPALLEKKL